MLRVDKTTLEHDIKDYAAVALGDGSYLHNDGDVYWYNVNGEVHREDGPAVIRCDIEARVQGVQGVQWHLEDHKVSFESWFLVADCSDEKKMMLRLQYGI